MTERPYANRDRTVADVFTGREIERTAVAGADAPIVVACPLAPGETVVWTADSMRRVTPLTFPDCATGGPRHAAAAARVSLARRERESFQVLVSAGADAGWQDGSVVLPVLRDPARLLEQRARLAEVIAGPVDGAARH